MEKKRRSIISSWLIADRVKQKKELRALRRGKVIKRLEGMAFCERDETFRFWMIRPC